MSKKRIPHFKTEDEEREFWATHDSTEYIDWSKAKRASFPNLRITTSSPQPARDWTKDRNDTKDGKDKGT